MLSDYRANSNPTPGAQQSNKPLLMAFDAASTPVFDSLEITGDVIFDALTGVLFGNGIDPVTVFNFAENEIPVGAIDSANRVFTLANSPISASLQLFLNGVLQRNGIDFTLAANTITYSVGATPQTGDNHYAYYRY